MDQVFEFIERIPEQFRYAIVLGISVIVVLLYVFLMRFPAQDELAAAERRYEEVHKTYMEKKRIADNLQYWQLEVQRLKSKLEDALTRLPKGVDVDELLVNIPNIAKKNALTVNTFTMEAERRKQGYAEVPMSLDMKGTFQGIGGFAQEVGEQPRIMAVQKLELKRASQSKQKKEEASEAEEEDRGVDLNIKAEVVTYRFVDQNQPAQPRKGGRGPR